MNQNALQQWTLEEQYLLGELRLQQPVDANPALYQTIIMASSAIDTYDTGPAKVQALRDLLALRDSLRRLNQQSMVLPTLGMIS